MRQLRADPDVRLTTVEAHNGRRPVPQQQMALLALCSTTTADPREPLCYAVLTFGSGYPRLLTGLRQAFPALSMS